MAVCMNGCASADTKSNSVSKKENSVVKSKKQKENKRDMESEKELQGLQVLSDSQFGQTYATEEGYYYLVMDEKETKSGELLVNIKYLDYATGKDVFLCNQANCKHNHYDCTCVLPKEAEQMEYYLFGEGDYLYLVFTPYDQAGAVETQWNIADGEEVMSITGDEQEPVIYRMHLDGTSREKMITLESGQVLESQFFSDGTYLYGITKKLSQSTEKEKTYIEEYDRALVRFDMETKEIKEMQPLENNQKVIGCCDRRWIINEVEYENELSIQESLDEEQYKAAWENATAHIKSLDMDTGKTTEYVALKQDKSHCEIVKNKKLYISQEGNKNITIVDLSTDEKRELTGKHSFAVTNVIDHVIVGEKWQNKEKYFCYFIDEETGNVTKSTLQNQYGTPIEIIAETKDFLYVWNDYKNRQEYVAWMDVTQEVIDTMTYSVITKKDYFANKANYKEIKVTKEK